MLNEGLQRLGLYSDGFAAALEHYMHMVMEANSAHSFVKADGNEFIIKHLLDCLAPWEIIRNPDFRRVCDIGSGAGLPGIPLALLFPDKRFFLVENKKRRIDFLTMVTHELKTENAVVVPHNAREVKQEFDLVTARAFRPITGKTLRVLGGVLNQHGRICLYKGKMQTIIKECSNVSSSKWSYQTQSVTVPFLDDERHVVILQRN